MKNTNKIILLIVLIVINFTNLFSQDLNEAKRLLKLANTYLDVDNYQLANEFLNQAKRIIANNDSWEGKYWSAVADETLGKFYMKMENYPLAKLSLEIALNKYKEIIRMKDGSPEAVNSLIQKIEDLEASVKIKDNTKIVSLDNTKIPSNLLLPTEIQSFSAINSKIKDFPYYLTTYKKIHTVILKQNKIKDFNIPTIKSLSYLDLSENKIKQINGDFSNLPNIEYLYLSNNSLKSLPISIGSLKKLKLLDIRNNNIPFSDIKNLIQSMPNTLILHDNYILDTEKGDELSEEIKDEENIEEN